MSPFTWRKDPASPACAKCETLTFVLVRESAKHGPLLCMGCWQNDEVPLIRKMWDADYLEDIPTETWNVPYHGPTKVHIPPGARPSGWPPAPTEPR